MMIMTGMNKIVYLKRWVPTIAIASLAILCSTGIALADTSTPSEVKYQEISAAEGKTDILKSGEVYVNLPEYISGLENDIPEYIHSTEYDVEYKKDANGNLIPKKNQDGTPMLDAAGNPVYEIKGEKKEKIQQYWKTENGELITPTEEQIKREKESSTEKNTEIYCDPEDGTYYEDVTVLSKNAIQKAIDKALAEASKQTADGKWVDEMVVRVMAGTYDGDINVSVPTATRSDWSGFTLKVLADDSFEMNGTELEISEIGWARPDLEDKKYELLLEDDFHMIHLDPDKEGIIKKDDNGNEIITADSAGNAKVNGSININGINVVLAGLYYSLESTIKAKNAIVDIYGTKKDDNITAVGAEGGKGTQISIHSGAGDDTVTVRGDVQLYSVRASGSESTKDEFMQIRVEPATISASSNVAVYAGAGDDIVNIDTSTAYFTATVSVDGGPANGSDRIHLTGQTTTESKANAETREIKLIYADGSTNIISEASMSEAKKHASYSQLIGKDKDGFFLNEEVFHKIFGASLSELPGTEEAEIKEIVIKTATASDSEGKDVYTVDTYTDDLEGKDYVYIDLSTPSDMPEIWNYINEANKKEGIYFTGTGELGSTWQNLVDYNIDVSSLYDESQKTVILKDIWFDGRDGNSPMGGFLSKVIIDSKHKPLNVTGRIGYKDAASADTLGIEGLNILIKSEKLTLCNGSSVIGNNVNLFAKTADTNLSDWLDEKIGFSLSDDLSIMDFVSDVSLKAEKGSTVYSRGETTVTSETDLTHGLIPYAAANTVAVKLGSSTLTLEGNITSAATVDIKSLVKIAIDVSNLLLSKWYIPVAVNVAISDAELTMKGNITANGRVKAGAQSDVLVTTKAVTGKLPVAIAVSVIDSDAHVKVDGATINSGKGRIELYANAETKAETAAQNKFNIRKPDKSTSSNSKQIASGSQTGDPKVSKYETVKTYGVWSAVAVVNQDTSVIIDKAVITSDSERGLTVRSESKQDIVTKSTSADPSIEEEKNKPQIASRSEEGKRQKSEVDKETESVFDKIYNFFSDKGSEENTSNANGPSDSVWDKIKNVISGAKASSSDANKKTDDANSQPDTPAAQFVGATTVLVDNNTSELITENSQFNVKKADFVSNAVTKLKTAADASQVKRPDGQKPDESYKPTFSGGIGVAVDVANITNNALIRSGTFTDTKLSALTDTVFDSVLSAAAGYNKGNYGISGVVAVAVNDVITQSAIMKPVVLKGKSSMVSKASSKVNVKTEAAGTMPKDYKDYQKVGVGAAVAVDVTNIETTAYVDKVSANENTDGKKEIKDITVSAKNTGKEELNAYAGSQGGVSFTPVVGVMVTGAYVEAVLGNPDEAKYVADGYVYDAGGSILIDTLNNMDRSLTVDAFAAGQSAAIGGTVAVSVINDTADSILKANSKSNTLKVNSKNVSNIKEKSTASAKGASPSTASDSESGSGTSNSGKSDGNGDSGSSDPSPDGQANGALDKIGKIVNGKSGKGAGKNQADNAKNRQKAETAEGKVAVAAAFVLSIQNLICKSEVIDGVSIVTFADPSVTEEEKAGDTIEVSAETIRKSDIFANGSTVKSEVGVGVAVAINLTDFDPLKDGTKAQIGNGIVNTGTLNMTANSDNTIITESVSGAGAKNVGIAGSVAITVAKTYSDAVVKSSSNKNSDRIIRLNVEESLKQNVETTASSRIDPLSGRADKNDDAVKDANKDVKGPNEPAVVVLENHDPQGTKTEKNLASTTNGKYNLPDKVDVPSWSGCKFNGYFNAESGGTKVYDENGKLIKTDIHPEDEGITLHAQWTDNRTDEQKKRDEKIKKDIQKKEQEEEERKQQEAAEGDSKVGVGAAFALTDAIASGTAKVTGRNIGAEDDESFAEKKIYISSYTISKGKAVAVAGHEDNSPKYALDAAVAIVILDTGAIAEISDAVIIGDILEISATSEDTTYTQASGKVKGGTAAVGASVAVNIPTTTTEAIFSGNATLTESAEITSKEDSTDTAYTVTSAKGASASKNVKKYDPNATDEDIENTKDDLNNDKTGKIDSYAGRTDVNPGNNTAGRINGAINGGKASNGNKTSNSLPVSTNVMRANNVKTEGTSEDTDLGKDIKKNVDDGNKESGAENNVPQTESTHIQFAAAVSVLDTSHKVHTYINKDNAYGTIIVTKGYINIASTCEEIFQSLATGAAMGKDNNNDIAAAVAVAVENNEALTTVGGKLEAQPDEEILENLEKAGDNTGVHITSFNKCNVGAALDMGAQALAGSFSGDESKVTISGAVAIIKSNNKSIVTVNKESNITGLNVVIFADDLSKMGVRAGGLSKAGEKSSVGLGASFALVYDNTRIQTIVEDNVKINAYGVLISSEKSGVTFTLNTLINHLMSAVVSINQPEGKQGLINIGLEPFEIKQNAYTDEQKKGDWTEAIPRYIRAFGNFQTQTNYYVEALAGNISGKDGGAAVAGSVGMLFYEVLTETNIGNNLQIGHPEYEINKGTVAKQKASASEAADKRYAEGSTLKEETEAAEKEFTVQEAKWNKIKEERKNTTAEGQAVYASYSEAKSEYNDLKEKYDEYQEFAEKYEAGEIKAEIDKKFDEFFSVVISAADRSDARLITGSLNVSKATAGVGVTVGVIRDTSSVIASVGNNADIDALQNFELTAEAGNTKGKQKDYIVVTVAPSINTGSSKFTVGGAVNVIIFKNKTFTANGTEEKIGTRAKLGDGSKVTAGEDIIIKAVDRSRLVNAVLDVAIGGATVAAGGSISVIVSGKKAEALSGNSNTLTSNGAKGITLRAFTDEEIYSVLASVTAGKKSSGKVGGTIAVLVTDSITTARLGQGTKAYANNGAINVTAENRTKMMPIDLSIVGGKSKVAVNGIVIVDIYRNYVNAIVEDGSNLYAKKDILVSAMSDIYNITPAAGLQATSGTGISGVILVTVGNTRVNAIVSAPQSLPEDEEIYIAPDTKLTGLGAKTELTAGDSIGVIADINSEQYIAGGDIAISLDDATSFGASVITTVLKQIANALVGNNVDLTALAVPVPTGSLLDPTSGIKVPREDSKRHGIIVSATNNQKLFQLGVMGNAGAGGNIGAGVNVVVNNNREKASVGSGVHKAGSDEESAQQGSSEGHHAGEILVNAKDTSKLMLSVDFLGIGVRTQADGTVDTLVFNKKVEAVLAGNNYALNGGDVSALADSVNDVYSFTNSLTGGKTAAAAVIGVLVIKDTVKSGLIGNVGSNTAAGAKDVSIKATSDNTVANIAAALSGSAGVGGGGVVLVTYFQQTVFAQIGNGTDSFVINADRDVNVIAKSKEFITPDAAGISAGVRSHVNGTVDVLVNKLTTKALVQKYITIKAGNKVTVSGDDDYQVFGVIGTIDAGGSVSIGISALVVVDINTITAEIFGEEGSAATGITAKSVEVNAASLRDIFMTSGSVAVGTTAGVGVAVSVLASGNKLPQDAYNMLYSGIDGITLQDIVEDAFAVATPSQVGDYQPDISLDTLIVGDGQSLASPSLATSSADSLEEYTIATDDADDYQRIPDDKLPNGDNYDADMVINPAPITNPDPAKDSYKNSITAAIYGGVRIKAVEDIDVTASEKVYANMFTGAVGASKIGVAVGLSTVVLFSNVNAIVYSGAELSAGKDIRITAVIGEKNPKTEYATASDADPYAGLMPGLANSRHDENRISKKIKRNQNLTAVMTEAYKAGFNFDKDNIKSGKILLVGAAIGVGQVGVAVNGGALVVMDKVKAILAGTVVSAGTLAVETKTEYSSLFALSGSIAAGQVGIGPSVAVVYHSADIETAISGDALVYDTDAVLVQSTGNANASLLAAALGAGYVGVGVGVAVGINKMKVLTYIGQGVLIDSINKPGKTEISVHSAFDVGMMANTFGIGAGYVGVGPSVAVLVSKLWSYTFIGKAPSYDSDKEDDEDWLKDRGITGSEARFITNAGTVTVSSETTGNLTAANADLGGGFVGVAVAVVVAINKIKSRAAIHAKDIIAENIDVWAVMSGDVDVAMGTVGGGAGSGGINVIVGKMNGVNEAIIDAEGWTIKATGNVTVEAGKENNYSDSTVNVQSYDVTLGGLTGYANVVLAYNTARNNAIVKGLDGKLELTGDLRVNAYGYTAARSYGYTANIAAAALGATVVYSKLNSVQRAVIDTTADIQAHCIKVLSEQNSERMHKPSTWTLEKVFNGDKFNPKKYDPAFDIPVKSNNEIAQAYIFYGSLQAISGGANVAIARADATSEAIIRGSSITSCTTIDVENKAKSTAFAEAAPLGIDISGLTIAAQVAHAYADGTFNAELTSNGRGASGEAGIRANGVNNDGNSITVNNEYETNASARLMPVLGYVNVGILGLNVNIIMAHAGTKSNSFISAPANSNYEIYGRGGVRVINNGKVSANTAIIPNLVSIKAGALASNVVKSILTATQKAYVDGAFIRADSLTVKSLYNVKDESESDGKSTPAAAEGTGAESKVLASVVAVTGAQIQPNVAIADSNSTVKSYVNASGMDISRDINIITLATSRAVSDILSPTVEVKGASIGINVLKSNARGSYQAYLSSYASGDRTAISAGNVSIITSYTADAKSVTTPVGNAGGVKISGVDIGVNSARSQTSGNAGSVINGNGNVKVTGDVNIITNGKVSSLTSSRDSGVTVSILNVSAPVLNTEIDFTQNAGFDFHGTGTVNGNLVVNSILNTDSKSEAGASGVGVELIKGSGYRANADSHSNNTASLEGVGTLSVGSADIEAKTVSNTKADISVGLSVSLLKICPLLADTYSHNSTNAIVSGITLISSGDVKIISDNKAVADSVAQTGIGVSLIAGEGSTIRTRIGDAGDKEKSYAAVQSGTVKAGNDIYVKAYNEGIATARLINGVNVSIVGINPGNNVPTIAYYDTQVYIGGTLDAGRNIELYAKSFGSGTTLVDGSTSVGVLVSANVKKPSNFVDQTVKITVAEKATLYAVGDINIHTDADVKLSAIANANHGGLFSGGKLQARNTLKRTVTIDILSGAAIKSKTGDIIITAEGGKNDDIYTFVTGNAGGFVSIDDGMLASTDYTSNIKINIQKGTSITAEDGNVKITALVSMNKVKNIVDTASGGFVAIMEDSAEFDWNSALGNALNAVVNIGMEGIGEKASISGNNINIFAGIGKMSITDTASVAVGGVGGNGRAYTRVRFGLTAEVNVAQAIIYGRENVSILTSGAPEFSGTNHVYIFSFASIKGFAGKVTASARFENNGIYINTNIFDGTYIKGGNIDINSIGLSINRTVDYDTSRKAIASRTVEAFDNVYGNGHTTIENVNSVVIELLSTYSRVRIDIDKDGTVNIAGPKSFISAQKDEESHTIKFSDTLPVAQGRILIGMNTVADLDNVVFKAQIGASGFAVNNESDYNLEFHALRFWPEGIVRDVVIFKGGNENPKYHLTLDSSTKDTEVIITNYKAADVSFNGFMDNEHGSLKLEWAGKNESGDYLRGNVLLGGNINLNSDAASPLWIHKLQIINAKNVGNETNRFYVYLCLDKDGGKPETEISASENAYLQLTLADVQMCFSEEELNNISTDPILQSLDISKVKADKNIDLVLGKAVRLKYIPDNRTFKLALPGEIEYTPEYYGDENTYTSLSEQDFEACYNAEKSDELYDAYDLPNGFTVFTNKAGLVKKVITDTGHIFDISGNEVYSKKIVFKNDGWILELKDGNGVLTFGEDATSGIVVIKIVDTDSGRTAENLAGEICEYDDASVNIVVATECETTSGKGTKNILISVDIDEFDDRFRAEVKGLPCDNEGNPLYSLYFVQGMDPSAVHDGDIRYAILRKNNGFNEFKGVLALRKEGDGGTKYVFASDLGDGKSVLQPTVFTSEMIQGMNLDDSEKYSYLIGAKVYLNPENPTAWYIIPTTNYYYHENGQPDTRDYYFPIEMGYDENGEAKEVTSIVSQKDATSSISIYDGTATVSITVYGVHTDIETGYGQVHVQKANSSDSTPSVPVEIHMIATVTESRYDEETGKHISSSEIMINFDLWKVRILTTDNEEEFLDYYYRKVINYPDNNVKARLGLTEDIKDFTGSYILYYGGGNVVVQEDFSWKTSDSALTKNHRGFYQSRFSMKGPQHLIHVSPEVCRDLNSNYYILVDGRWIKVPDDEQKTSVSKKPYSFENSDGTIETATLSEYKRATVSESGTKYEMVIAFGEDKLPNDTFRYTYQILFSEASPETPIGMVRLDNLTGFFNWYRYDKDRQIWMPGNGVTAEYKSKNVGFLGYNLKDIEGLEVTIEAEDSDAVLDGSVEAQKLTFITDGKIGSATPVDASYNGAFRFTATGSEGDIYINRRTPEGASLSELTMYIFNDGDNSNAAHMHYDESIKRVLGGFYAPGKNLTIGEDGILYGDYESGRRFGISAGALNMNKDTVYLEALGDLTIDTIDGNIVDISGDNARIKAVNKGGRAANIRARIINVNVGDDIGEAANYLYYYRKDKNLEPTFTSLRELQDDSQHVFVRELPDPQPIHHSSIDGTSRGEWVKRSEDRWQYRYYNNRGGYSYVKNSWDYLLWKGFRYWYHFDADGFMQVGWFTDGFGNRFYLSVIHDNWYGHMLTDWQLIDGFWYYFTPTNSKYAGRMLTGWQFIGGKWYYFETRDNIKGRPMGSLYMNTVTPDGYRVGVDGAWIDSPVQV